MRFLIFVSFLSYSCTGSKEEASSFSSKRGLYVDYISSYTSGIISSKASIKVKLAKKAEDAVPGEELKWQVFDFEPQIKGKAFWEDNSTIVFEPEQKLADNQQYKVRFHLKKILEVPKDKEEFRFLFQVMKQNFEITSDGISLYDQQQLNRVKIVGSIITADYANNEEMEKMLTATQNGKKLTTSWEHLAGMNLHHFSVEQVERKEEAGKVKLSWNGSPIGVAQENSMEVEVPSLKDFKVLSAKVSRGEETYLSVKFSDPLLKNQDLRGLVQLQGVAKEPRLVTHLNELKIYPSFGNQENIKISIFKGVKNAAGFQLEENFETTLFVSQQKPELKLAREDKGVIMPGSGGLILPFEAVGLKEVDVTIVRIFEDNVLQYLQVNNLGGASELRRVARPVSKKVIPLSASGVVDLNKWNRYTLDLSEIINTEPGAIYQVKLNFRKNQSLYFCGATADEKLQDTEEEWEAEEEASNWDYYDYDYYDDYNWSERNNPCSSSYFRNKGVSKILFASDLGIMAKKSDQGDLYLFVTNLLTTKPEEAVKLEVYDYQQQLIASGSTSMEGKAELQVKGKPFVVIARQGKQIGYLKLADGNSLSLSNFDVSGQTIQKGIKGFLYGERGVWRPGDTLHLSFMLEDKQKVLPQNHPVILELYNPLGQIVERKVKTSGLEGIFVFDIATPADAPTGNWLAKAKVGGVEFEKSLKIETVKPNRLKINLDFGRERLSALDKEISGDLNVRWLHGAKAQNLKAKFDVVFLPIKTSFKGYDGFSFDDASKEIYSEEHTIFEGRVDSEGYAKVNFKFNSEFKAPGALKAVFKGKAFEEGGDFSIDQFSIPYYPYTSFVGIKAPEGDRRKLLLTDQDHSIRIVSVDAKGNAVDRSRVKVELYKLNWKWWWDNSHESLSNYVGTSYRSPVQESYINTRNGEGEWALRINNPEWGRFYIKVTDPVSGHSAGEIVSLDWPGWAQGKKGELDGASMLSFSTDKEEYKAGEKIKLNFPSSAGGRALVSLETGSKVLQTFWVETEAENTKVEFEATANMTPNVYLSISLIQPHAQTVNDLPIRLYGVQSVKVADPETNLQPLVELDKELRPEAPFTVSVKEKEGKPMAYTLAVVEEGLLDLTRFKTPDPWQTFYTREALGVKTWDMYNEVLGAYGGNIERLLAVGGDDELKKGEDKEANRFKPVVKFVGPFYLQAGKTAQHTLHMPQYIGSVRTMVIAAREGAYGFGEATTPVKQPLMVLATLPRVAGPGEEIVLPVNIFTMNPDLKQVKLEVKATGNLKLEGEGSRTVQFSKPGDQISYFKLKAEEALGTGKVVVTATSGKFTATYDVEMNVRASNPEFVTAEEKLIAGKENWEVAYQPLGLKGTNYGVIELSTLPALNLEQRLQYLIQYPHGCVEQTTSAVFAQLYLDRLTKPDEELQKRIEHNIQAAISRLKSFQLSSGGLAYWPGNTEVNSWGTNYAGHFLLEAKNKGYHVPEGLLSSWVSYQQQAAENWNPSLQQGELDQAYRLHTLALAGKPAIGAMNRMKESTANTAAKWRLALAYAIAGHKTEAEKLVEGLSLEVKEYRELSGTFGSQQRDQAMILETLTRIGQQEQAFGVLRSLAFYMSRQDQWMSTQTTAYALIAIAQYAEKNKVGDKMQVKVLINGKEVAVNSDQVISLVHLQSPQQSQKVTVQNTGTSAVYARLIKRGVPLTGEEKEEEKNIRLNVVYKNMNGEVIDPAQLVQGTDFVASISVHNTGTGREYKELALNQIFPSGWEIINNRLNDTPQFYKQGAPHYQDIRDDRVYTYFDLKANERKEFTVLLNASYKGKFYMPSVTVEAMYDNSIFANKAGMWIEVTEN